MIIITLQEFYDPTIEDSYIKDNYIVDDETFSLEIFDTAGQVRNISIINRRSGTD